MKQGRVCHCHSMIFEKEKKTVGPYLNKVSHNGIKQGINELNNNKINLIKHKNLSKPNVYPHWSQIFIKISKQP